jgi:peptidyl-prolyl cis-trans isomerase B (cyclophilin B)
VDGMDVVDQIQNVERDNNNRPINDIKILKATVIKDLSIKNSSNNVHNKISKNKSRTLNLKKLNQ